MDWKVCGSFTLLLFLYFVPESKAWSGNYCTRLALTWDYREYCISRYVWGCSAWSGSWVARYYTDYYCCSGWTHNGNQSCTILAGSPTPVHAENTVKPKFL